MLKKLINKLPKFDIEEIKLAAMLIIGFTVLSLVGAGWYVMIKGLIGLIF